MNRRIAALGAAAAWCGTASAAPPPVVKVIERAAHDGYIAAINSNDLDAFLADLTPDIVYQSPNEPEIVGKDAVREWAAAYLAAYRIKWQKSSIGFTVAGDWAFECYTYASTDTTARPARYRPIAARASTSSTTTETENGAWRWTGGARACRRSKRSMAGIRPAPPTFVRAKAGIPGWGNFPAES